MSDVIQETIDTLSELKRLHQLNFELLEQLNVVCQWMLDNCIYVPDEEKIRSLLGKSLTLLREIQADTPKIIQYQKLTDEKKQHFRTDEEEPVPKRKIFNSFFSHTVEKWLKMGDCVPRC